MPASDINLEFDYLFIFNDRNNPRVITQYFGTVIRGFFGTNARLHEVNGWDSVLQQDPTVKFFKGFEEDNLFIVQEQCRFTRPNEVFTEADGYRDINREGVLTLNNTVSDAHLMKSPYYDMVGWHRQSPIAMFTGQALDSYFGGESWCADGSNGSVNHQIRNISFEAYGAFPRWRRR